MGKSRVPGGYVDVPRYLYDALLAAPGLSGGQLKVVFAVVRLTWGFYPDKNRDGASIGRKSLARYSGLSRRTVDKVIPVLMGEGIVEQLSPPHGRSAAVLRLNPNPQAWGRFVPVGYSAAGTLEALSTGKPTDPPSERTQSTPDGVPKVRQMEHSTGSPVLPSLGLPFDELPSGDAAPDYEQIQSATLRRLAERVGKSFTDREAP